MGGQRVNCELGLCYKPIHQTIQVPVNDAAAAEDAAGGSCGSMGVISLKFELPEFESKREMVVR